MSPAKKGGRRGRLETTEGKRRGAAPPGRRRQPLTPAVPETTATLRLFAQLGLRIPADLALRLKGFCQTRGFCLNWVAAEALGRYLDQEERR